MLDALYTAASGMLAQQTAMDVIANNLANTNTDGYKAHRTSFSDLLYTEIGPRQSAAQGQVQGTGARVTAIQTTQSQGAMVDATNLDLAIVGNGYLPVTRADGTTAYTRAGALTLDAAGNVLTAGGDMLQPPIRVPQGADMQTFTIEKSGRVTVKVNDRVQALGQLQLATFQNPYGLENIGSNLFRVTANSGAPQLRNPGQNGAGDIQQGFLEKSNVNAVDEMVGMISTQRSYEAVAKIVSASDEMLGIANALRR
jgi:flagellar basal-body rod protein FlgG